MVQEQIIKKLAENRHLLTTYGIKVIRLFGSAARGEAGSGSDVDLLV